MIDANHDGIPDVVSPYAGTRLRAPTQLAISAYWFATNFMWGALLTVMLPAEAQRFAPSAKVAALALLTGVSALIALTVPLLVGALSDRCASRWGRRRPFMAVGMAINLVGLGLMALAFSRAMPLRDTGANVTVALLASPTYVLFGLAYMVVQFGNNVTSAAYSGMIPDLVPEDQRGSASGYMALMSQLGTLFGAVGSGLLLGGTPDAVKYAVIGLVLAGVGAWTLLGVQETPLPQKPLPIAWGAYIKSLWIDPKQHPDFAWVWITRALVMLGFYSIQPFINYYLADVIGSKNPGGDAPIVLGIVLVASTFSALQAGRLSDRIGRKRVVYWANASIAVMALGFIFCRSLIDVVLVGLVFGLGFGAYTSVDWALGTDVLPSQADAAKEMAVWHVAMTLPQSIAAPAAGLLISSFGKTAGGFDAKGDAIVHYTLRGYASVFVLCAVCFALGAYLLKNVKGVR